MVLCIVLCACRLKYRSTALFLTVAYRKLSWMNEKVDMFSIFVASHSSRGLLERVISSVPVKHRLSKKMMSSLNRYVLVIISVVQP